MARLRSPAGRGHLFHWSVKVDGCCFRILCDQLRAPSNHPAPYVENKSPCLRAHSSCDGCLYVCVCMCVCPCCFSEVQCHWHRPLYYLMHSPAGGGGWCLESWQLSLLFFFFLPFSLSDFSLPCSYFLITSLNSFFSQQSNRFAGSAQSDGDVFASFRLCFWHFWKSRSVLGKLL